MTLAKSTLDRADGAAPFPDPESRSAALHQRARAVLPGGNSRHSVFFPPYPLYAARGRGSRIWDVDGVERLDCVNNYSALIHGHCHPVVVEAITHQASELISVALPTASEVQLAELLVERLEAVERGFRRRHRRSPCFRDVRWDGSTRARGNRTGRRPPLTM